MVSHHLGSREGGNPGGGAGPALPRNLLEPLLVAVHHQHREPVLIRSGVAVCLCILG